MTVDFMAALKDRARANVQRVVFPESGEENILKAARQAFDDGLALPILLGDPAELAAKAAEYGLALDGMEVVDLGDPAVVAELVEDGAWMLRWMVAGFADWQADHHWVAVSVKAATAAYEAEQDALAGFLGRRCVLNAQATVSVDQLHEAYIIDTMENGDEGVQPLAKIAFGKRLKSRNLTQAKATGGVRVWRGIALVATSGKNSG